MVRGTNVIVVFGIVLMITPIQVHSLYPLTIGESWIYVNSNQNSQLLETVMNTSFYQNDDVQIELATIATNRSFPFAFYNMYQSFEGLGELKNVSIEINMQFKNDGYLHITREGGIPIYHSHTIYGFVESIVTFKDGRMYFYKQNFGVDTIGDQSLQWEFDGNLEEGLNGSGTSFYKIKQWYQWNNYTSVGFTSDLSLISGSFGSNFDRTYYINYENLNFYFRMDNPNRTDQFYLSFDILDTNNIVSTGLLYIRKNGSIIVPGIGTEFVYTEIEDNFAMELNFNDKISYPVSITQYSSINGRLNMYQIAQQQNLDKFLASITTPNPDPMTQIDLSPITETEKTAIDPQILLFLAVIFIAATVILYTIRRRNLANKRLSNPNYDSIRSKRPGEITRMVLEGYGEVKICCNLTSRLGERYCQCGLSVPDKLFNYHNKK